ncbi:metallophosphoesterase [Granulicella sp. S156]|uniref:metallophosphoesterase family protein n=1 Tax=Granulicella sp. S156 TaxID=1747224 RepID=UPI00131CD2CD|nr:metallophosphoesterase [Granulicella sp. S156]
MTEKRKSIAYVTDAHIGQKIVLGEKAESGKMRYLRESEEHKDNLKLILDDIAKRGITEVVFGGDIGTKDGNEWFFNLIGKYNFKLRMVLGNHDSFSEVSKHYSSPNSDDELKYAYEEGSFKYIYLDSSSNSISDHQFRWLQQEMNTEKKMILFLHHPVLEIDTPLDRAGAALNAREKIRAALLEAKRETVIFCGHYHMEDDAIDGNIRQFVTPAASYQIVKISDEIAIDEQSFGYRLMEIDGSEISTEVVMFKK